MPSTPLSSSYFATTAVLRAQRVTFERADQVILRDVTLTVGPRACLGVIGPNGVGKSTLLRLLAGELRASSGSITLEPPLATVGYLDQEHADRPGETVRQRMARRVGVAGVDEELQEAASALADETLASSERYERALQRFEALEAATFDARAETVLYELDLGDFVDTRTDTLSGGQRAKVALATLALSRFDAVLLDEPTNDLDFAGLARLESWVRSRVGATIVVSHDRSFLERTVTYVLDIDEHTRTATEYGGGWAGFLSERENARRLAREAFDEYREKRDTLEARAKRQREWSITGVSKEKKNPRDHDTAQRDFRINRTEKQASKARQSEKALARLAEVDKPFEGWNLHFSIDEAQRSGDVVVALRDAVIEREGFQLGLIDVEIGWSDRVALVGANGAGKSTLIAAMLGSLALSSGSRVMGPSVIVGELGQDRRALEGDHTLARYVGDRCGLTQSETRSLLAKFGLHAGHVTRPTRLLSPGERTRSELAIFQARGVNFLVLDEPTNHLDLAAIEQLEEALSTYRGTLLLATHDRTFFEAVSVTRTFDVTNGHVIERD